MKPFVELTFGYAITLNLFGFLLMGYDKYKAKKRDWRIPEVRLFLIAFLGGATGVYAGMRLFRHKTRHASFRWGIPALIVVNVIMLMLILRAI